MPERKTVRRWWWVWDFEKEEAWLNTMALEGWALDGVGFAVFHFVRCEPGEYTIRIEMDPEAGGYQELLAETGAERVGRCARWVYYRRRSELGAFDLFSDLDSRVRHLERIARMLLAIGLVNILLGCINTLNTSSLGILNLLCGCLLMYALGRIRGKEDKLKRERTLRE